MGRWSPEGSLATTVLEYSAATHAGLVRSVNEDSFFAGPPVFVVADGMGGHDQGEVASALVAASFESLAGRESVAPGDLDDCIERARQEIFELADGDSAPGSTVMAAAFVLQSGRGYWLTAHEGDSRAYVWRDGELRSLTRDHSLVQEMIDAGEIDLAEARFHPDRNVITRALGGYADSRPEFCLEPVESGTRLVLCTDGLTGEVSESSMAQILKESSGSTEAAQRLIDAAVGAGGHDNVTVVVVDVITPDAGDVQPDTLDPRRVSAMEPDDDTLPSAKTLRK